MAIHNDLWYDEWAKAYGELISMMRLRCSCDTCLYYIDEEDGYGRDCMNTGGCVILPPPSFCCNNWVKRGY
jgi:hypothetical protein